MESRWSHTKPETITEAFVKMAELQISPTFPLLNLCAYSFIFCAHLITDCHAQTNETPRIDNEVVLWKKGDNGVAYYRIPIITSLPDGTLLALSEARKHSSSDSGPKFLAIRQSQDMGTTWSPTSFIEDDKEAPDGLNLGSITVDKETGKIFVMYSFCFHKCSVHTTYVIQSANQGKDWTTPQNISNQIGTFAFAPGPGYGIQKTRDPHKGRLITCGHSSGSDEGMYCVVSDDHGLTWKVAGALPREKNTDANECQPVELEDGSILITARNQLQNECHCRIMAKSYDACQSFSEIYFDKTLIDPTVAASLLNYKSVLYFSNPVNQNVRMNMTIHWSGDEGETWKGALTIWKAASGYSCLTDVPSTRSNKTFVGLVFEKGNLVYFESIAFVRIEV